VTIGRKHYALCNDECAEKLQNDPESYLAADKP
jgi:YHS domain-containing protein